MITSQAYDKYILKSEKNSTNDNISTDRQRFVEIYNEYQNRYIEYKLGLKNEEELRSIESLLIREFKIKESKKGRESFSFKIPKDYFDLSSVYALGSKGKCVSKKIDLIEVSDIEKDIYISDYHTKPSFEYRESLFTIGSGQINIYFNNFTVDSAVISYYRHPKQLTLQDPENPESQFDDTFNLDLDDKSIDKIISAAVSGFDINNNSDRWQLNNILAKKDL